VPWPIFKLLAATPATPYYNHITLKPPPSIQQSLAASTLASTSNAQHLKHATTLAVATLPVVTSRLIAAFGDLSLCCSNTLAIAFTPCCINS